MTSYYRNETQLESIMTRVQGLMGSCVLYNTARRTSSHVHTERFNLILTTDRVSHKIIFDFSASHEIIFKIGMISFEAPTLVYLPTCTL